MYINKKFLDELYKESLRFDYEGERLYVQKIELGAIAIEDGTLLVADPYQINCGIRVLEGVANGIYPVEVFSGTFPPHEEHKILALKVKLKEEVPTRYEMALPKGMVQESVPEDGFYGIKTESGNLMILDEATCEDLITKVDESYELAKEMEEKLALTYFEVGGIADVKLKDKEKNFMTVVSGSDKGAFPVYLAYHEDELVGLIIDFLYLDEA